MSVTVQPGVTFVVAIGNTDNRLTQQQWSAYCALVDDLMRTGSVRVWGEWHSLPNAPYQNAAWSVLMLLSKRDELKASLRAAAKRFDQHSIALVEGDTEMLLGEDA